MLDSQADPTPTAGVLRWRLAAALLLLGTALWRILYLANSPLDLSPDEAHYWDWSRHLDWSYYSKGPLVAYLIRLGCELCGGLSLALTGTETLAVRLPAVVCGSLFLLSLYVLTARVTRRESLALLVVAFALTLPVVSVGASLMTIDAPYTCLWGWALVAGHRAVFRPTRGAWALTGLLVGLGVLAKYTMILWLPSLGLFLLTSPAHRRQLVRPGFWLMVAVAGVCCLPILIWNAQHEWVTFRHVSGQAGLAEQVGGVRWLGPLQFVVLQFALLLGFWFVFWARALWTYAPWKEPDAELRYLWWLSVPMFAVFCLFGFKTGGGEPNWPVTAYASGLILATVWLAREWQARNVWRRRAAQVSTVAACGLGLALTAAVYFSPLLYPVLVPLAGAPTAREPLPLRRFDPTCRLRGWRSLAAAVDEERAKLRSEDGEPVLVATGWNLPGQVGFYCAGHPTVHSLGLAFGDRRSQYDFWGPNPLWQPEQFHGRTFLLIAPGDVPPPGGFEQVEAARVVTHTEAGQPVARWTIRVCRGFQGFGELPWLGARHNF